MKRITRNNIGKLFLALLCLTTTIQSIQADDHKQRHELDNMHVTIRATDYKHSQFIEEETIKGKKFIKGKASSYNKDGEAKTKTLLQPCAEYAIKSKMPGGTYHVTIHYSIDKDVAPEKPEIAIGINTQKPQHIEIKNKLINKVKATFKVNFFKGKSHTVKVWFPSEGVRIHEIKITKALISKKD